MSRKRLTQLFPWLLPLRKKQRLLCFYTGMSLDRNHYSSQQREILLPYQLFETSCPMYNSETGFDMIYQENKVFNLKLAAKTLDRLVICPGETFSFWKLVRYADKHTPYKDGLVVSDGKLQTLPGGGLCQMSNLLFWLFLHTPLKIVDMFLSASGEIVFNEVNTIPGFTTHSRFPNMLKAVVYLLNRSFPQRLNGR